MTLLDEAERRHRREMSKRGGRSKAIPRSKKCLWCDRILREDQGTRLEGLNGRLCDNCHTKASSDAEFWEKIRIWD